MWRDLKGKYWGDICDTLGKLEGRDIWYHMFAFPELTLTNGWVVHLWVDSNEVWNECLDTLSCIEGLKVLASALTEHPSYYM